MRRSGPWGSLNCWHSESINQINQRLSFSLAAKSVEGRPLSLRDNISNAHRRISKRMWSSIESSPFNGREPVRIYERSSPQRLKRTSKQRLQNDTILIPSHYLHNSQVEDWRAEYVQEQNDKTPNKSGDEVGNFFQSRREKEREEPRTFEWKIFKGKQWEIKLLHPKSRNESAIQLFQRRKTEKVQLVALVAQFPTFQRNRELINETH